MPRSCKKTVRGEFLENGKRKPILQATVAVVLMSGLASAHVPTVGERPAFPKTFLKINPAYRILHHTLIKHYEMMISIS
jgi:hypothetical protein